MNKRIDSLWFLGVALLLRINAVGLSSREVAAASTIMALVFFAISAYVYIKGEDK